MTGSFQILELSLVRGRGAVRGRGPVRGHDDAAIDDGRKKASDSELPAMKSFTDNTGPTQILPVTSTPIKFFVQIFDGDFFDCVVEATNLNAATKSPPTSDTPARGPYATSDTYWYPTTAKEMGASYNAPRPY